MTTVSDILVAYATAAGSTKEVAETIGQVLRDAGATVDVRRAKQVVDVAPYRAAVLGSGVRMGRTYGEARAFLKKHKAKLSEMPVAAFVVCLAMKDDTEQSCQEAEGYLDAMFEATPQIVPVDKAMFGGVLDYDKLSWLMGRMLKMGDLAGGDFRDWETIRGWAEGLYPALLRE